MPPAQYCKSCPDFLRDHGACPNPQKSLVWVCITLATFYIPFIYSFILIFQRKLRHLKPFIYMNLAYILSDQGIKSLFKSPRPEGSCKLGFGMPSSHMAKMSIFLVLRLVYSPYKWQKIFWTLFTFIFGISRMQLNYHYPQQVFFGAVAGLLFFFVCQFGWSFIDVALPDINPDGQPSELTDEIDNKK